MLHIRQPYQLFKAICIYDFQYPFVQPFPSEKLSFRNILMSKPTFNSLAARTWVCLQLV